MLLILWVGATNLKCTLSAFLLTVVLCCVEINFTFDIQQFSLAGAKLRPLTDVAENYHLVLEENRRLYNEVQDLKGVLGI